MFIVGHEKKLLMVHSALIAHHSKPLDVLVNGDMSEAKEGCALLDDVDEHTFVRFSQYAYTGDYAPRDPDILLSSSAIATTTTTLNMLALHQPVFRPPWSLNEEPPEPTFNEFTWSRKQKKNKEPRVFEFVEASQSKRSILWEDFKGKAYPISGPIFQPRKNHEPCEDYIEVFLGHARLYVFADKYDVERLRVLTLHKLHRTLAEFTLHGERVGDIVELMRYSYSNTADRSGPIDDLRSLVIHYAACIAEDLTQSKDFRSLLEEASPLAGDLFEQMLRRLD